MTHAAPSEIRLSASPRFLHPQTNGTLNECFPIWCWSSAMVKTSDSCKSAMPPVTTVRKTHIDVVYTDRLQDLSFDGMSNSDLCHDGNRDSFHDSLDHARVGLFVSSVPESGLEHTIRATPPSRLMFAGIRSNYQLSLYW
jgi:hypothetical protein